MIADIEERKNLGLRKYGTLLQPFNGRSFLLDAYEEVLDLAVYLRGKIEEERQKEQAKFPALEIEGETLWPLGDPDSHCTCVNPVPSYTGFDFPVCANCMSRVGDEKLAHKQ